MLSTNSVVPSKPNLRVCCICRTSISLDHCMIDEQGLAVHISCHEKKLLLKAAAQQSDLWRRNLPSTKTA